MEGQMNAPPAKADRPVEQSKWDKPLNIPAPRPEVPAVPGRLYVGGLPRDVTPEALSKLLVAFGVKVEHIDFNSKNVPGLGTNFAFVDVLPVEKAAVCVSQLNRTKWKGHALRVELAKPSKLSKSLADIHAVDTGEAKEGDKNKPATGDDSDDALADKKAKNKEGKRVGPWKRGKAGRLLPVLTLEKKNGRGTFIHDPAKTKYNITIFPSSAADTPNVPLSRLTYFYDESLGVAAAAVAAEPQPRPPSPRPANDRVAVKLDREREFSLSIIDSLASGGSPVGFSGDEEEDGGYEDGVYGEDEAEEARGQHDEFKVEWEARKNACLWQRPEKRAPQPQNKRLVEKKQEKTSKPETHPHKATKGKEKEEKEKEKEKEKTESKKEKAKVKDREPTPMEEEASDVMAIEEQKTAPRTTARSPQKKKQSHPQPIAVPAQATSPQAPPKQAQQQEEKPTATTDKDQIEQEHRQKELQEQQPETNTKPTQAERKTESVVTVNTSPHMEVEVEEKATEPATEVQPNKIEGQKTGEQPQQASTPTGEESGLRVGERGWWTSMLSSAAPAVDAPKEPAFSLFSILPTPPAEAPKPAKTKKQIDPAIASALKSMKDAPKPPPGATSAAGARKRPAPLAAPKRFLSACQDDDYSGPAFVRPDSWEKVEEEWASSRQALSQDYKNKFKTARKRQRATPADPST